MRPTYFIPALLLLPAIAAAEDQQDPRKDLFVAKCVSCHSIGEGKRVGPDLKGVADRRESAWLFQIIQAPSALLSSDADARALLAEYNGIKMPDLGLSDADVNGLVDFIKECSAKKCDLAAALKPVTDATEADIARGMAIYLGNVAQEAGGPPCISCHTVAGAGAVVAGGNLAKDITHAFARLGDQGLDAALKSPAFAVMNKIYAEKPLNAGEVYALRSFLYQVNRGALANLAQPPGHPLGVPLAAALIAILSLILMNAAWSRRLRGVRHELVGKRES